MTHLARLEPQSADQALDVIAIAIARALARQHHAAALASRREELPDGQDAPLRR